MENFSIKIFSIFSIVFFHLILWSLFSPCWSQIRFNRAMPISQTQWIFRLDEQIGRSADTNGTISRDLMSYRTSFLGVYGVTDRLALFLELPIVVNDFKLSPAGVERTSAGLGDMSLMARYTVFSWNRMFKTIRISPFVSLEMPTGQDDDYDQYGRIPQNLQPGSGGWDPSVGLAFLYEDLRFQVPISLSYKYNQEANGFQFGQQVEADITAKFRIYPFYLTNGMPSFLFLGVKSHTVWRDQDSGFDPYFLSQSGWTSHMAPIIQWIAKRYLLEAMFMFPIVEDLNPGRLENDWNFVFGGSVNF